MDDAKPHLIVGVDFGMTCTGMLVNNIHQRQLRPVTDELLYASCRVPNTDYLQYYNDNRKRALTSGFLC